MTYEIQDDSLERFIQFMYLGSDYGQAIYDLLKNTDENITDQG